MTSPRVVELPRRLEPVSRDTFLGAGEAQAAARLVYVADVVAPRAREGAGAGRGVRRPGSIGAAPVAEPDQRSRASASACTGPASATGCGPSRFVVT